MKLKDLIKKYKWDDIFPVYIELYPDMKKSINSYKKVFNTLYSLKPANSKWSIVIEDCYDEEEKKHYAHVTGKNPDPNKKETYSLCLMDWPEWLGMNISYKALRRYPKLEIIAHCLWEMTYFGNQEDIDKRWEYIYETVEKIQKKKK